MDRLEEKRKIKAQAYFERKVGAMIIPNRMMVNTDVSECYS